MDTNVASFLRIAATLSLALLINSPRPGRAETSAELSGREMLQEAFCAEAFVAGDCSRSDLLTPSSVWRERLDATVLPEDGFAGTMLAAKGSDESIAAGRNDGGKGSTRNGWHWRKASLAELAAIGVAAGGTLYSEAVYGEPDHANWKSTNRFDDGIRNALRLGSRSARDAAASLSDALMGALIAEPILDSFYTMGYRDRQWGELWQTSVINLESFTFSALVSSVTENALKRQKPFVRECPDGSCADEQPNRSMVSGHAAFAFTGAGLYCTNHRYNSQYDPAKERAVCYTSLGVAALDGVLRVVSDRHYATDVIAGSAVGLFSGFLLPRMLHYWWPAEQRPAASGKEGNSMLRRLSLEPQILAGGAALSCSIGF